MSFTPDKAFAQPNHASIRRLSTQTVPQKTRLLALEHGRTDYLYGNEPRLIILFRVSVSKIENNPSLSRRVHQIVLRAKYITEWKMFHQPNRNNLSENRAKQTMGWDNLILLQHLGASYQGLYAIEFFGFPWKVHFVLCFRRNHQTSCNKPLERRSLAFLWFLIGNSIWVVTKTT